MKIVIISATMQADEPIYRKFYKPIEDDLFFTGNQYLKYMNITRYNVDRRFDISARVPYSVKELWLSEDIPYDHVLKEIYSKNKL